MLKRPTILPDHINHGKSRKTVCVTACLTALGIPVDAFQVTSTDKNVCAFEGVIRRNGFALRSRKSAMPKRATVGNCRKAIAKLDDPVGTHYVVHVRGHLLLLDSEGKTVVDTAPRKRDKRGILRIHAAWRK